MSEYKSCDVIKVLGEQNCSLILENDKLSREFDEIIKDSLKEVNTMKEIHLLMYNTFILGIMYGKREERKKKKKKEK